MRREYHEIQIKEIDYVSNAIADVPAGYGR